MTTYTVSDLATRLDTDARTTRKFLRSITPADEQPGKGSRWVIEAKQVRSLQAKFKKFTAEVEAAAKEREERPLTLTKAPIDTDEATDLEPTDEALELIDAE